LALNSLLFFDLETTNTDIFQAEIIEGFFLDNLGKMDLENLSKRAGIPTEQLSPFLDAMIKENHIMKDGDLYILTAKK